MKGKKGRKNHSHHQKKPKKHGVPEKPRLLGSSLHVFGLGLELEKPSSQRLW
jgi:hypothetical protein